MPRARGDERGAATVEHAGLVLLIALLIAGALVTLRTPPERETHALARAIAQKMRCAPRLPGPCWRDPLTEAYGRTLAGAVRALAPGPVALPGPTGLGELPVDFRYCRRPSCAATGPTPGLTASNRRVSDFVAAEAKARGATITYWHYRPGLGWGRTTVAADHERIAALARTPLLESDVPRLVPLETLDGRNHVRFTATEEPPWRWRVQSVYP